MRVTNSRDDAREYVVNLIHYTKLKKVFPVTHKNNHGISLDIWEEALQELGIEYAREKYLHHMASASRSYDYQSERIVLKEGGE